MAKLRKAGCVMVLMASLVTLLSGCMHTRYAESSSLMSCQTGGCPCSSHDSAYKERRWSGLWLGQPAAVQP